MTHRFDSFWANFSVFTSSRVGEPSIYSYGYKLGNQKDYVRKILCCKKVFLTNAKTFCTKDSEVEEIHNGLSIAQINQQRAAFITITHSVNRAVSREARQDIFLGHAQT